MVLPIMMSNTPESISKMPQTSLKVSGSPNTVMPMNTAVSGSNAPIIADGVEPMLRMDIVISTSDKKVGTMANIKANSHDLGVGRAWMCVSGDRKECSTMPAMQNSST